MDSSRFSRPRYWIIAAAILTLTAAPATIYLVRRAPAVPSVSFSEFLRQVDANAVARLTFNERAIAIVFKDGTQAHTVAPPEFLSANSVFMNDLVRRRVEVEAAPAPDPGSLS